jgi:hypothetical protein
MEFKKQQSVNKWIRMIPKLKKKRGKYTKSKNNKIGTVAKLKKVNTLIQIQIQIQ